MQKVIVVGAGPVGALAALYAAKRGDDVHVYEMRADLRDASTTPLNFTKSINLALSVRGIHSMKLACAEGLLDDVLRETIPMHGRMIHGRGKDGELFEESQAYDAHGRYIQAVDRANLNKRLLNTLAKFPNVTLHFDHKLTGANFDKKVAWFERIDHDRRTDHPQNPSTEHRGTTKQRAAEIEVSFDFLIGADGAHSAARFHMMKFARVNFQQEYIDTLWCEFRIEPKSSDSSFAIHPNRLHIWPGGSLMFIAIPSVDKSFTCTLFAPAAYFESLSENPEDRLQKYFYRDFPGVCPELIPPLTLLQQFRDNPHLPLISIKCSPHHYKSTAVILGDAAHAMVPFYGQGMNAGLEDVRVLFEILDKHGVYGFNEINHTNQDLAREAALDDYTSQRTPDAATINDLALRNYHEMRSAVQSPFYKIRKWMEETIHIYLPNLGVRTQYTRVSFENERYSEVEKAVQRQGRILMGALTLSVLGLSGLGTLGVRRNYALHISNWLKNFFEP